MEVLALTVSVYVCECILCVCAQWVSGFILTDHTFLAVFIKLSEQKTVDMFVFILRQSCPY